MARGIGPIVNRNFLVSLPSARLFESIHAARRDIQIAIEMIKLVLADESPDGVEEAAWTTAVIRYVRALKADEKLIPFWESAFASLSQDEADLHSHLLTIRDGMYAHNVGIGSDYTATAHVGKYSDGKLVLWGVGIQSARISSPGQDAATRFKCILDRIAEMLWKEEEKQHRTIVHELRQVPESHWIAGGEYSRNLNFDDSSKKYRSERSKRSKGNK